MVQAASGAAWFLARKPWTGLASLQVEPVSRASCTQRAGRAGRTRPGRVIRLYTKHDHDLRRAFEVDFEVENAVPNRTWNVRIKHDGRNTLRTQRATDFEGELDVIHNVRDRRGQDRIVVRAKSTTGEVCRVKLSI